MQEGRRRLRALRVLRVLSFPALGFYEFRGFRVWGLGFRIRGFPERARTLDEPQARGGGEGLGQEVGGPGVGVWGRCGLVILHLEV